MTVAPIAQPDTAGGGGAGGAGDGRHPRGVSVKLLGFGWWFVGVPRRCPRHRGCDG